MEAETSHPELAEPARTELRILSVDDVPVCRKLVQNVLEKEGHLVIHAVNGQEAFDMINTAPDVFDLIVTDHNMPVLDGLGLVRQLRGHEFKGPIIVVSAGLTDQEATIYRALGVHAILTKPLMIDALRIAVRALQK